MIGIVNVGGGALLVDVVGGATKPVNPMNNTIWVETTDPITAWAIGYNFPDTPREGNVAVICRGNISPANLELGFPDTSVKICPAYYYQYLTGEWVSKTGSMYQSGSWVDVLDFLYNRGRWNTAFHEGGWIGSSPVENATNIEFKIQGATVGSKEYVSGTAVDLAGFSKLVLEHTTAYWSITGYTDPPQFGLVGEDGTSVILPLTSFTEQTSTVKTTEFDISSYNTKAKLKFRVSITGASGSQSSSASHCTLDVYSIKLVPED